MCGVSIIEVSVSRVPDTEQQQQKKSSNNGYKRAFYYMANTQPSCFFKLHYHLSDPFSTDLTLPIKVRNFGSAAGEESVLINQFLLTISNLAFLSGERLENQI